MPFDFLERTVDSYIPWQGHITDHAVLFTDGSVYAMLALTGVRWETTDGIDTRARCLRLNHTWKQISDETVTITIYQHRCRAADDAVASCGLFSNPFSEGFDRTYRARLVEHALYENRLYIGIQVHPKVYGSKLLHQHMLNRQKPAEDADDDRLQRLEEVVKLLLGELQPYNPRRLGLRLTKFSAFSEIAEAIVRLLTSVWRPIPLTTGPLSQSMLSEHEIVDKDHIRILLPGEVRYGRMFGMRHFPSTTNPHMFNRLLTSPYWSTVCQSFRFLKNSDGQEVMRRKRSRMLLANDDAEEQRESLKKAASDFRNADYALGEYCFGALVFASDMGKLDHFSTEAWTDLADSGMTVSPERLGLEAAYYAMVPGNAHYRPRPGYVSSRNFAGMAPLHAFIGGPKEGHWGKPIMDFISPAQTVIHFHFHVAGSGNVLITGQNGSGKTVLAASLIVMTEGRARIIALDHKRGWELMIRRMGGSYATLGGGEAHFAPLKALSLDGPNGTRNYEFLVELLRGCIMLDGMGEPTSEEDRRLALGIRSVMALPPEDRGLEEVRNFLGVGTEGAAARLRKWCHGQELGWVIDAPVDTLTLAGRLHGADTTALLDNVRARGPALLYLFHRIELELDGQPVLIPMDEGWRALLDDTFRPMIEKRFRTIRSFNGVFIFITQGVREIIDSKIAAVIIEQCNTQIHLPNPRATESDYVDELKRTPGEVEALKTLPPGSGFFLLCQGEESCIAQLYLPPQMADYIATLSSRESTLRLFHQARAQTDNIDDAFAVFHETREMAETL